MRIHFFLFSVIFLGIIQDSMAQLKPEIKVWQLSGLVVDQDQQEPIPYVSVYVNRTRNGVLANGEGFYSVPVTEKDTVRFYSMGNKPAMLVMKDYLADYEGDKSSPYLYAITYMETDSFSLPEIKIMPYSTVAELRAAVRNMDVPHNTAEEHAMKNLDPRVMNAIIEAMPVDGDERLVVARQAYYNQFQSQYLMPTASLNPLAAMRMLKYIADKAKNKRDKNLNYWE